jgi:hypothetical protein
MKDHLAAARRYRDRAEQMRKLVLTIEDPEHQAGGKREKAGFVDQRVRGSLNFLL